MIIVDPTLYLVALSKSDLRILKAALNQWQGPYHPEETRTPAEAEYESKAMARGREMETKIWEFLNR